MKTTLTSSIASLGLVLLFGTTAVGEDRTKVSLPEAAQATEQDRLSAVSPNAAFARLQAIPAEALTSHEMAAIQGKYFRTTLVIVGSGSWTEGKAMTKSQIADHQAKGGYYRY